MSSMQDDRHFILLDLITLIILGKQYSCFNYNINYITCQVFLLVLCSLLFNNTVLTSEVMLNDMSHDRMMSEGNQEG
jgi:hypothetical protein